VYNSIYLTTLPATRTSWRRKVGCFNENTGWSVWDVTKINKNVAEKNLLYYQLMVHKRLGETPLSRHNKLTLNMTATEDAAKFIPLGQFALRCVQHFRRDLCKGRSELSEVSFNCDVCPYTSDLKYSHTKKSGGVKSGEFAAHGMGLSGRTSVCCMRRLKSPALWEPNVAERCRVGRWWCPSCVNCGSINSWSICSTNSFLSKN
jgi:hypothetical protein